MSQAIRSHDMLFEKFEIFYYDGIQYLDQSNVCQFTQKILIDARVIYPIWAKIIEPYLSWFTIWESCWKFVAFWDTMHRQK